jgi:ubiquinone/menaquinone biosynthesis C-methylase UbiE
MNKKVIWEKVYEKPLDKIPWENAQFDWIKELIDNGMIKGKTFLDLGCGSGSKTLYLAEKVEFEEIIGVDISEKAIEIAKSRNIKNSKFFAHDACDLSFLGDKKFDFILDWANIHGIPKEKIEKYIEEINNHSKIGTLLLVRSFSKENSGDASFMNMPDNITVHLFSKEDIIKLFSNFEILKENESKTNTPKGEMFFVELLMKRKR